MCKTAESFSEHLPRHFSGTVRHPPKTRGIKFQSRGSPRRRRDRSDDGRGGMTRRIALRSSIREHAEDEGRGRKRAGSYRKLPSACVPRPPFPPSFARGSRRGIYSCVDSGKLWSIKEQISNSIETARYKHYSRVQRDSRPARPRRILFSRAPSRTSRSAPRPFLLEYDFQAFLRVR